MIRFYKTNYLRVRILNLLFNGNSIMNRTKSVFRVDTLVTEQEHRMSTASNVNSNYSGL